MRILVVDDEPVARARVERLLAGAGETDVVTAGDGPTAVNAIVDQKPSIVFLDVQMPGHDGFAVIEQIGVHAMPVTVFVTAYEAHATRAFDAHALDYLVKPYDDNRFLAALERARKQVHDGRLRELGARFEALMAAQRTENQVTGDGELTADAQSGRLDRLVIRKDNRIRLRRTSEVEWFESAGVYARVHFSGESFLLRIPMHELEARLDPAAFVRVHRSAIVNIDCIRELRDAGRGDYAVVLQNGTRVKLSRTRRVSLERRLGQSL